MEIEKLKNLLQEKKEQANRAMIAGPTQRSYNLGRATLAGEILDFIKSEELLEEMKDLELTGK